MFTKFSKPLKAVTCAVFWVGVWYAVAFAVKSAVILPMPHTVVVRLFGLLTTAAFYLTCLRSLVRVFSGLLLGVWVGVILSVSAYLGMDFIFSPLMSVIRSTPVASVIILMLFFLGRQSVPYVTTMMMVTPVVYVGTLRGLRSVPDKMMQIADVFSMKPAYRVKYLYVPSALPHFSSAVVNCTGLAWKAGIAAEVICTPAGAIGSKLWDAKVYLESTDLFAWTLTVVIFSLVIEKCISTVLKRSEVGRSA